MLCRTDLEWCCAALKAAGNHERDEGRPQPALVGKPANGEQGREDCALFECSIRNEHACAFVQKVLPVAICGATFPGQYARRPIRIRLTDEEMLDTSTNEKRLPKEPR